MSRRQHTSIDRQIAHAAGQRKITRYCSCRRAITGNAGWWSHTNANPAHERISYSQWLAAQGAQQGGQQQ